MKIFYKKHWIFLILIFNGFNTVIFSQTLNETIKFADSLLSENKFEIAIAAYQRVIFFQDTVNPYIYYNLAEAYYFSENYSEAIKYYKSFGSGSADSSKINESSFKIIICNILNSDFQTAMVYLYSLPENLNFEQSQRKNFYLGVCYYYFENYKTSFEYFNKCIDSTDVVKVSLINDFFSDKNNFRYPNKNIAFALSLVFPGAGQLYCGDFKNAAKSFLLISVIAFLGYEVALSYKPLDLILTVFPYFERYYVGGALNAYNLAIDKKLEKKSENFNHLLEIIKD